MAQKKQVVAKSSAGKASVGKSPATKSAAKSTSKTKAASVAKSTKRSEAKAAQPKSHVTAKSAAKPLAKSKAPAKAPVAKAKAAPVKVVPAKAVKPASKPAPKAVEKVDGKPAAAAVQAKPAAAKPAVKPAESPAAAKPAGAAKPVAASVSPGTPAEAHAVASKPVAPQAARPTATAAPAAAGRPDQMFRPAGPVQFGTPAGAAAMGARTLSSALPKPAMRSFPAPGVTAGPAMPRDLAQKAVDARQQQMAGALAGGPKKPVTVRHGFKINESIVYPAHGVGRIIGIEEQEIAGQPLELFVIQFEKDKMTLKVPTGKLQTVGMRKLAEDDIVSKAMETLKGRARVKRTMWSRRAQEYEAKINSGDLVSIAEVVRDLYRSESQPEQSYSERQLYEAALDRMAREIAAVARIDERGAVQRITEVLSKSAKGRRAAEATEVDAGDSDGEADAKAA